MGKIYKGEYTIARGIGQWEIFKNGERVDSCKTYREACRVVHAYTPAGIYMLVMPNGERHFLKSPKFHGVGRSWQQLIGRTATISGRNVSLEESDGQRLRRSPSCFYCGREW